MTGKLSSALLLGALIAGCGRSSSTLTTATIPAPDELTLYAIDGLVNEPESFVTDAKHFRGYEVLGKLEITDPESRREIMAAVLAGIGESDGTVASCFWPRHGVHVVTDGKAVDYVICYECLQAYVFSEAGNTGEATTNTHQAVLSDRLTAAGIKLAPGMKEKIRESNSGNSN